MVVREKFKYVQYIILLFTKDFHNNGFLHPVIIIKTVDDTLNEIADTKFF